MSHKKRTFRLPEDDRNLYKCSDVPKHMASAVDTGGYKLYYEGFFGGVSALTRDQFEQINGASNQFWGWGGEDDDLVERIPGFTRVSPEIGRYTTLKHGPPHKNNEYDKVIFDRLDFSKNNRK